jgi:hypothetical protein
MKALCAVQGIACRDMSGKGIFDEFGKLMVKEREQREYLKLGLKSPNSPKQHSDHQLSGDEMFHSVESGERKVP